MADIEKPTVLTLENRVQLSAGQFLIISRTVQRLADGKLLFNWKVALEVDGLEIWDITTNAPNGFELETLRRKIMLSRSLKQKSLVLDWLKSQTQLNL